MSRPGDPRFTAQWRRLRAAVVVEEPICWLRLPGICTLVSTTADHLHTVATRPDLALDRGNLRGACKPCNDRRNATPVEQLPVLIAALMQQKGEKECAALAWFE